MAADLSLMIGRKPGWRDETETVGLCNLIFESPAGDLHHHNMPGISPFKIIYINSFKHVIRSSVSIGCNMSHLSHCQECKGYPMD